MTINICVVLQDDMGGLERDVVINLMTVPDTATCTYIYTSITLRKFKKHILPY